MPRRKPVTPGLRIAATFYIGVLRSLRPKILKPLSRAASAVVLYTDAEWSTRKTPASSELACASHSTGMGALAFLDNDSWAAEGEATGQVVCSLPQRETQIMSLELLAIAAAIVSNTELYRGRDLLAFCDNQSACGCVVKGASKALDLQLYSSALHAMCRHLHICLWIEYVPTDSNPADELSRLGTTPFCSSVCPLWMPNWAVVPSEAPWLCLSATGAYPLRETSRILPVSTRPS